jgi:hypothetical protein
MSQTPLCNNGNIGCIEVCTAPSTAPSGTTLSDTEKTCLRCPDTNGDLPDITSFNRSWINGDCNSVIESCYKNNSSVTCPDAITGAKRMTRVLSIMMGSDGSSFDKKGQNLPQNAALSLCGGPYSNVPSACDYYISNVLTKLGITYDDMSYNPGSANWLGCYIPPPPNQIANYDNTGAGVTPSCVYGGQDYPSMPCFPMCMRYNSVHLYSPPPTVTLCECQPNVCVIDNVTVDQTSNSSVGNVQITQLCPGCTYQTPCTCIISSDSLKTTTSDVGLSSTTFNQYCGEQSTCYNINDDGTLTNVPCQNYLAGYNASAVNVSVPVVVFIIGIILFVIVLVAMYASKRTKPYVPPPPPKPKPKRGAISNKPLGDKTSSMQF